VHVRLGPGVAAAAPRRHPRRPQAGREPGQVEVLGDSAYGSAWPAPPSPTPGIPRSSDRHPCVPPPVAETVPTGRCSSSRRHAGAGCRADMLDCWPNPAGSQGTWPGRSRRRGEQVRPEQKKYQWRSSAQPAPTRMRSMRERLYRQLALINNGPEAMWLHQGDVLPMVASPTTANTAGQRLVREGPGRPPPPPESVRALAGAASYRPPPPRQMHAGAPSPTSTPAADSMANASRKVSVNRPCATRNRPASS
jgi:hypothetical protein